jgi:transposase
VRFRSETISRAPEAENQSHKSEDVTQHCLPEVRMLDCAGQDSPPWESLYRENVTPTTHLLRLIEKPISFAFVRERLKSSYSDTGRPSIDPELLLRILLIGYLYGITSERKLVEELRMHLAWRWFTGLGFDQEIPHHSTFSKNRHGRFQESKLFEELFEQIVRQCVEVGLVQGTHLSVDGSFMRGL